MQDNRGRTKGLELNLNQLLWRGLGFMARYRYQDIKDDYLPINDREDHLVSAGFRYLQQQRCPGRLIGNLPLGAL